ncbi:MAG: hypothetical protein COT74_03520 [Bdellovibrionales bacterium CG10_big_fil_rev_8_21_14_0_10_45_34]|nr:MAG: hypothetical protein COT74_03520 [Bdellovibrionales bacterium CG10_big_fil_rev_8_21_14_0_10_45_34]
MEIPLLLVVSVFFLSISITYAVRAMALRHGWVSVTDFRRTNEKRVPLLGGIAIFVGVFVSNLIWNFDFAASFLFSSILLVCVGVFDDILELRPRYKFLAHLLAVGMWFYLTPYESTILSQLPIPEAIGYLVGGFWFIGIINALNMIDGMDGESSSVAIISALCLFAVSTNVGTSQFSLSLAVACMGFLLYNFPPAKIYLGESGSSLLGFLLAGLSLHTMVEPFQWWHVLAPLFLLSFPEIDAVLAMYRRFKNNTSISVGDRDHLHHKLQKIDFSVRQTLIIIVCASLYSALTTVALLEAQSASLASMISILALGGLLLLLGATLYFEKKRALLLSSYSQGMIKKHLALTEELFFDANHFNGMVIDLLPYYKELQTRGLLAVQDFLRDTSELLRNNFPNAQFKLIGLYTLVSIHPEGALTPEIQQKVAGDFFVLLDRNRVRKNGDGLPWGLSFCTNKYSKEQFFKLLGRDLQIQESFSKVS